jgi:hypothetical protein
MRNSGLRALRRVAIGQRVLACGAPLSVRALGARSLSAMQHSHMLQSPALCAAHSHLRHRRLSSGGGVPKENLVPHRLQHGELSSVFAMCDSDGDGKLNEKNVTLESRHNATQPNRGDAHR